MATTFPLELVTPERMLFSDQVQMVRAPGVEGSFGVLAHHAPMLTELTTGLIKLVLADGREAFIATSGGFLQVTREKVIILADTAELSEEIDIERARAAAERARQRLAMPGTSGEEERLALERALNRIRVAQMRS
ncbi:MAG: F0F1 ATP synthase subunit epsilon [Chloroherpetonaceae bacterium]|nr:F0F1 ATP synthase subunit epsilon [Chthonomonadaceae bacterium]MDW8208151.1 F0F1 ATP synthase subunit epsilon [Chloroherpetonaceae bacterium]